MNPQPSCVSKALGECVDGLVQTISTDESESETEDTLRHQLVERWFRERFFLPRPYRSTSLYDADSSIQNDIIDDGSSSAQRSSMALFSDNLVSREIRSSIVPVSDDEDSCSLRYRHEGPSGSVDTLHKSSSSGMSIDLVSGDTLGSPSQRQRQVPSGIVVVCDGAPFMPLDRNERDEPNVILECKSADDSRDHIFENEDNKSRRSSGTAGLVNNCCEQPSMGFIQRTFSFDEQLPMVYQRGASMRTLNCSQQTILEDDSYADDQPMVTIPVTYAKENNRAKIVYPISIS